MCRFLFSLLLLSALTICGLSAQSLAIKGVPGTDLATASSNNLEVVRDWPIFLDAENRVYFIDFAAFTTNLNRIVVRNAAAKIVLEDELFDLPADTIYEVDFANLPDGRYSIELQSVSVKYEQSVTMK